MGDLRMDSISKIRRTVNNSFENVTFKDGEWNSNNIKDSFEQTKTIDTYLLIVPADKKGALEDVIIDALKDIPEEKELIQEVILFINSLKELFGAFEQLGRKRDKYIGIGK